MQSLRDKLLQAGLVTAEQAEKSRSKPEALKRPPRGPSLPARVETDKERERRENRELADKQKKIRALCDAHEVSERGEQTFFFRTRKRELRRLLLKPEQVASLEKGELAVVDRPNGNERPHALVPRDIAEQVLALEPRALRFWAKSPTESFGFEDEPADAAPTEPDAK
jgi:uncharacterized protein YaiL (DUF2058 family)